MSTEYEKGLIASYFMNASKAWRTNPARQRLLAKIVEIYSPDFGLSYTYPETKKTISVAGKKSRVERSPRLRLTEANIKQLQDYLARVVKRFEKEPMPDEHVFLDNFLGQLGFEAVDRKIGLLLLESSGGAFESFFDAFSEEKKRPSTIDVISAFLGQDKKVVQPHLKLDAPLLNSGIVYMVARDYEGLSITDRIVYHLHRGLIESIDNGESDVKGVIDRLIGKAVRPEVEWDDFEHIKRDADFAAKIVKNALEKGVPGTNILVYGETGTGKTEFCKTLAAHLDVPLYAVGENPDTAEDDFEDDRNLPTSSAAARLSDKRLVENMLGRRSIRALTMFDEMEDVLRAAQIEGSQGKHSSFQLSKSATNTLLTSNEAPCLWTTNNIDRFDPAMLRRFSFAIELKTPNAEVRQRVILRTLKRYGQELTSSEARNLAETHAVPPAFFSRAIESAALVSNGDKEGFLSDLNLGLRSIARIVRFDTATKTPRPVENYDLGLVNTNWDLGKLTEKIVSGGHRNFSICGYGVSGAGKSEYLVYLAHKLGMDALLVPYSEVGNEYVSKTEQNIHLKFEQAADEEKFLIFDEADSLLTDRRLARNSWEKTIVNEMLTRMERHPFPFGCTTNLMDTIDQASLRRFVFKVRFNGLTPAQGRKAYLSYFKHDLPEGIVLPNIVAPGDFSNVLRQAKILDTLDDSKWLVDALIRECKDKKTESSRPIGFGGLRPVQKLGL